MAKNSDKNKGRENLKPWKKGQSGNPNGRPKGQKNYSTIYWEALEKLAKTNDKSAEELHSEIIQKGVLQARKGDYRFYKDVLDREYGKAKENVDVTSKGEKIIFTPAELIDKHELDGKDKTSQSTESDSEEQKEVQGN